MDIIKSKLQCGKNDLRFKLKIQFDIMQGTLFNASTIITVSTNKIKLVFIKTKNISILTIVKSELLL